MSNKPKKPMVKKKKRKTPWTRVVAMTIALLLALIMVVSAITGALSASAVTQAEIDRLKDKLATTQREKDNLKSQISSISGDVTAISKQISILDSQIDNARNEVETQQELIDQLGQMIQTKTIELQESELEQEEQYAQMLNRVRFMAENGSMSYLEILLSADSFSDFLNRYEIVKQVSIYEQNLFEELKEATDAVNAQKAELEQTQADEQQIKSEMENNERELEKQLAEKQSELGKLENQESEANKALADVIEQEDDLMDSIRQKAAELAAQKTYVGGTFMWPLPAANNVVTCKYGMRTHPVTGRYSMHTGVDLRATSGTKIYAANGGTVVTSGYSSVWGNYVVINHGGGYTTLYAHMTKRLVAKNEKVSRGDVIGYVGSTGYSTAPHLHFEIGKNGSSINPLTEFEGFRVIYS